MFEFPEKLAACTGFEWDEGNRDKNQEKHGVSLQECEQVFFNRPLLIAPDRTHSETEPRFAALGQTSAGRTMTIVFTVRGRLIRVVSARDMSRRERSVYER